MNPMDFIISPNLKSNELFLRYLALGMVATIERARTAIEKVFQCRRTTDDTLFDRSLGELQQSNTELHGIIGKCLREVVIDNINKTRKNTPITMGLSSGFDSRAILTVLREENIPVFTYTYGQKGCLDFDFAKLYRLNADSMFFDTSTLNWSLEEYQDNIIKFQDYPLSPRVVVNRALENYFPVRYDMHGYLNGSLTGNTIPEQSETWETAVEIFCEKNNQFKLQNIIGQDLVHSLLPGKPFVAQQILPFDRQLDLSFRQQQRIRPVDSHQTIYVLPFEDDRWIEFWLEQPFEEIRGQRLYISFLKSLKNDVFFDLNKAEEEERISLRRCRIRQMYGNLYRSKLKLMKYSRVARPTNPTAHFCLFTCFLNNQSFRKMLHQSISRLKSRNIFRSSFIDSVVQYFKAGDANSAAMVNALVSADILIEIGIFDH